MALLPDEHRIAFLVRSSGWPEPESEQRQMKCAAFTQSNVPDDRISGGCSVQMPYCRN